MRRRSAKKQHKEPLVAVITGGSSGIGRKIAIELARSDFDICVCYLADEGRARSVCRTIKRIGRKACAACVDTTNEQSIQKLFLQIQKTYGKIDLLVNNAAIYSYGSIENADSGAWLRTLAVNLYGKFLCIKYAIPLLRRSKNASIVNIASRCAQRPASGSSSYCCAAAGIAMLSQATALELSRYKIRCNTISPGLTRTPMTTKACASSSFKRYASKNPLRRLGTPEDIARVVRFLAGEHASFITGENINVSGGIVLV